MIQSNHDSSGKSDSADKAALTLPCDHRYRTSKYFLLDQLRCSDAAADFRHIRTLIEQAAGLRGRQALQFQPQAVPIRIDNQRR